MDQSYTLISISVDQFDDSVISGLMKKHGQCIASARITSSRFGTNTDSSLKFFVHHRLGDFHAAIADIESAFSNNKISKTLHK
jgi:hypothetical protein